MHIIDLEGTSYLARFLWKEVRPGLTSKKVQSMSSTSNAKQEEVASSSQDQAEPALPEEKEMEMEGKQRKQGQSKLCLRKRKG